MISADVMYTNLYLGRLGSPEFWNYKSDVILRFRMSDLRSQAFRIYLQHVLSSALVVDSIVSQREGRLHIYSIDTAVASATWVHYCRDAQIVCGVYSIAAVDRAESRLINCLQYECSFHNYDRLMNEDQARKYEKAAYCYANAALRQSLFDSFNAALWSNAGGVYDQVDPSKLVITGEKPNSDDDEREWKAYAVQYESPAGDSSPTATLPQVVAQGLKLLCFTGPLWPKTRYLVRFHPEQTTGTTAHRKAGQLLVQPRASYALWSILKTHEPARR
jgi:hypothetical protein